MLSRPWALHGWPGRCNIDNHCRRNSRHESRTAAAVPAGPRLIDERTVDPDPAAFVRLDTERRCWPNGLGNRPGEIVNLTRIRSTHAQSLCSGLRVFIACQVDGEQWSAAIIGQ